MSSLREVLPHWHQSHLCSKMTHAFDGLEPDDEFAAIVQPLVWGLAGRYFVRGAMDPLFASPEARDDYARRLARWAPGLAAEFLRGWVEHHDHDTDADHAVLVWHRYLAGTRTCVEVSTTEVA